MSERTVTLQGNPITLEGTTLNIGDKAPDFTLQSGSLQDITLANYAGKTLLLSVVPSLDTGVCALQTKKFNEKASQLPDSVAILTVSTDRPFAQGRFCGAEGIDKIESASDHRDVNFGRAYGVLIAEGALARILTRAIFVINPEGVLTHVEYVSEVAQEPDYDAALSAVNV